MEPDYLHITVEGNRHTMTISFVGKKEEQQQMENDSLAQKKIRLLKLEREGARILSIKKAILKDNPPGTLRLNVIITYNTTAPLDIDREIKENMSFQGANEEMIDIAENATKLTDEVLFYAPFRQFMLQRVKKSPEGDILQDDLFQAYNAFCRKAGNIPLPDKQFNQMIKNKLGWPVIKRKTGWLNKKAWQGIAFKSEP